MGGEALPETKSVLFCSTDAGEGAAADAMLKQSIVVASMNMLDLLVIVELKCFVVVAWICFFCCYKRKYPQSVCWLVGGFFSLLLLVQNSNG